jgi:glycosyltransferase involved in cell wall biosynthesis
MKRKVMLISPVYPFPVDTGKKVVLSGMIQYLLEHYDRKHFFYLLINPDAENVDNIHDLQLVPLRTPTVFTQLRNVFIDVFLSRKKSIQEAVLFSESIKKQIHSAIERISPDIIICDTIRTGQFLKDQGRPKGTYSLYMEDLFSIRYRRMREVMMKYPRVNIGPMGSFSTFLPRFASTLASFRGIQKFLLAMEEDLVWKSECSIVKSFHKNLLVSEVEVLFLKEHAQATNIENIKPLLPNSATTTRRFTGNPLFVFVGKLNVPHNEYSLIHFIEKCLPDILMLKPDTQLRIIGKGATERIRNKVSQHPRVLSLEGYVSDLDSVFSEACAMIAPILFGSGIKLKVLEALSRGLPVIATRTGVEGLQINSAASGCVVAEDLHDFPEAMSRACDIGINAELSRDALNFYEANYGKPVIYKSYDNIFAPMIERM